MADVTVPATQTPAEDKALRLAWELGRMTLTAEVHDDPTDMNPYQAKVVDVVRIGAALHFVVVLDD